MSDPLSDLDTMEYIKIIAKVEAVKNDLDFEVVNDE